MKDIGIVSSICLPLFNIPLILRIIQRRSSADISLVWTVGIWLCIMGMLPDSLVSGDIVLKTLEILSAIFFSAVFIVVVYYHPALRKK